MGEYTGPIDADEIDDEVLDRVSTIDVPPSVEFDRSKSIEEYMNMEFDDLQIRDTTQDLVDKEMERVENAIRGAVRAGYDGVDINRPPLSAGMDAIGIRSIDPWTRPAPDGANGHRTTRYTWDWFSDEELAVILQSDNPMDAFDA